MAAGSAPLPCYGRPRYATLRHATPRADFLFDTKPRARALLLCKTTAAAPDTATPPQPRNTKAQHRNTDIRHGSTRCGRGGAGWGRAGQGVSREQPKPVFGSGGRGVGGGRGLARCTCPTSVVSQGRPGHGGGGERGASGRPGRPGQRRAEAPTTHIRRYNASPARLVPGEKRRGGGGRLWITGNGGKGRVQCRWLLS